MSFVLVFTRAPREPIKTQVAFTSSQFIQGHQTIRIMPETRLHLVCKYCKKVTPRLSQHINKEICGEPCDAQRKLDNITVKELVKEARSKALLLTKQAVVTERAIFPFHMGNDAIATGIRNFCKFQGIEVVPDAAPRRLRRRNPAQPRRRALAEQQLPERRPTRPSATTATTSTDTPAQARQDTQTSSSDDSDIAPEPALPEPRPARKFPSPTTLGGMRKRSEQHRPLSVKRAGRSSRVPIEPRVLIQKL